MSSIKINVLNWYLDLTHLLTLLLTHFPSSEPPDDASVQGLFIAIRNIFKVWVKLDLSISFFFFLFLTVHSGTWRSPFSLWSFTFLKHKPAHCLPTESYSLSVSSSLTEEPSSVAKMSVRRQRPKQIPCIPGSSVKRSEWMKSVWKPSFPWWLLRVRSKSCFPVKFVLMGQRLDSLFAMRPFKKHG